MFTRDDAKHPCTQTTCVRGFAVGHIEPYRCTRIRLQGGPLVHGHVDYQNSESRENATIWKQLTCRESPIIVNEMI